MKAREYIIAKQTQWALNHGIKLIGSKGNRGQPTYTTKLEDNLLEPLQPEVYRAFQKGDGNEVNIIKDGPAKMQAIHSSSALAVNIFQYWQRINQVPAIAAACRLCRKGSKISTAIEFEEQFEIDKKFRYTPNIDVVIHNSESTRYSVFAIECKFTEAYGNRKHLGLSQKYLNLGIWYDMPALHHLAKEISPNDNKYLYLHPAQLIKHILGLKNVFKSRTAFRLLYLWYDVLGEEGAVHRKEIEKFSEIAKSDGVIFQALSYQDLITCLSNEYRNTHERYIKYITERYL